MEFHRTDSDISAAIGNPGLKVKSSTRMRYEAEVLFLKRQNGDLDEIRQKLGLSRRKICQLLLVDPSAWTRWTQPGGEAPPHIYRALDWYISILEKDPEYRRLANRFGQWLNQEKDVEGRLANLEAAIQTKSPGFWRDFEPWQWFSIGCAILGVAALAFEFLRR
jgi:hypothetical protein